MLIGVKDVAGLVLTMLPAVQASRFERLTSGLMPRLHRGMGSVLPRLRLLRAPETAVRSRNWYKIIVRPHDGSRLRSGRGASRSRRDVEPNCRRLRARRHAHGWWACRTPGGGRRPGAAARWQRWQRQ